MIQISLNRAFKHTLFSDICSNGNNHRYKYHLNSVCLKVLSMTLAGHVIHGSCHDGMMNDALPAAPTCVSGGEGASEVLLPNCHSVGVPGLKVLLQFVCLVQCLSGSGLRKRLWRIFSKKGCMWYITLAGFYEHLYATGIHISKHTMIYPQTKCALLKLDISAFL